MSYFRSDDGFLKKRGMGGNKLFICFVEGISNIMTVSKKDKTYTVYSSDTCLVGVPV